MATMTRTQPVAKTKPIYWWALIGVFFAALQIYIYTSATLAGDFMNRADPGPTPIPEWMRINFVIQDTFWGILLLVTFVGWVLLPFIKERRFSQEGLLWLGVFSILWQDPLENYQHLAFAYNTAPVNIGGWACHIPGWVSPGGCGIAEPIFWLPAFYLVCITSLLVYGIRFVNKFKANHPHVSTVKIFFWLAVFVAFFDIVFEVSEIALGYYHYGGLAMSVFPDTRFRFPIWEPILVAILFVVMAVPYYHRNDRGETWMERGLSEVTGGTAKKQWLRLFAFVGVMNLCYIVGYNGPIIMISIIKHHEWPEDVQNKSYFTNGMCGEGTSYACGGDNIATGRNGSSIHIGPNGELVIPPGTKVPKLIPHLRTAE